MSVENDVHRERARELYAAGDPEKYIRQIFGWTLARDQKRALNAWMNNPMLLLVGANGTGKSALLHALTLGWGFDATGSTLGEDGKCIGGIVLLIAPTGRATKKVYQKHFLGLGQKAKERGHLMPGWGRQSMRTADWQAVEGHWYIEGITATREAESADEVSHYVLGVHHENLIILYDEIKAIPRSVVEAGKGRLRGALNKAGASTNPTSNTGLGYVLSQVEHWPTIYSSAVGRMGFGDGESKIEPLEAHENVQERREIFPGAVSHLAVEADLRDQRNFEIRGKWWGGSEKLPEGFCWPKPEAGDFCYALPPIGLEDVLGPREDGFPGHLGCDVLVIRPLTGIAYGRIVGGWPPVDPRSLFGAYMLGKAVELGLSVPDAEGSPRVVGVDASYAAGGDEMIGTPWWGLSCRDLLELAWEARPSKESSIQNGAQVLMGEFHPEGCDCATCWPESSVEKPSFAYPGVPAIIGEPYSLAVTKSGAEAANQLVARWGTTPIYQVDLGGGHGVGSSLKALGCTVRWMQFGGAAAKPLPGQERAAFNARAEWSFSLADATGLGLVVMCRDRKAHEDLIAFGVPELQERAAPRGSGVGAKVEVMKLMKTELIKKMLGRSPDRGASILCASARPIVMRWK